MRKIVKENDFFYVRLFNENLKIKIKLLRNLYIFKLFNLYIDELK